MNDEIDEDWGDRVTGWEEVKFKLQPHELEVLRDLRAWTERESTRYAAPLELGGA